MTYAVKEIFYTLQGEGSTPAGRRSSAASPAAICGPAASRTAARPSASSATPISSASTAGRRQVRGAAALADARAGAWPGEAVGRGEPLVVCTGGEPLLQLDAAADRRPAQRGFEVAVETNGTAPPAGHRLGLRQSQGGAAGVTAATS